MMNEETPSNALPRDNYFFSKIHQKFENTLTIYLYLIKLIKVQGENYDE